MKIHIYVKTRDLEHLNKILKDPFSETTKEFEFSNIPFQESTMISLTFDQWIRLQDMEALITLVSL